MSKLKMVDTVLPIVLKYEVPAAVAGLELLMGTIKCGAR
jgi:hypothetical protein